MIYCDSFERYGVELISLEYIIIGPLIRVGEAGDDNLCMKVYTLFKLASL